MIRLFIYIHKYTNIIYNLYTYLHRHTELQLHFGVSSKYTNCWFAAKGELARKNRKNRNQQKSLDWNVCIAISTEMCLMSPGKPSKTTIKTHKTITVHHSKTILLQAFWTPLKTKKIVEIAIFLNPSKPTHFLVVFVAVNLTQGTRSSSAAIRAAEPGVQHESPLKSYRNPIGKKGSSSNHSHH